jgi:hypothetical protein
MQRYYVDDMSNEDKALNIIIPDLNTSISINNVNGDHDNISGKLYYLYFSKVWN